MEIIKAFIKKIMTPSNYRLGLYITADSKMEAVYYNANTGEIYNAEKVSIQYNQALREINIQDFEQVLLQLYQKMEISYNTPLCISVPNILTSVKSLPSDLEDDEIAVVFSSEAEKSYIFKKTEPKASWNLLSSNPENLTTTYLYSIIQKSQADGIEDVCNRNNLNLFAIDTSFASLIRGLVASGVTNENIENNLKWCVVIISANNYIISKFEGSTLLNIIETPLALRSIEENVLYPTLNAALTEKLQQEKINNLYIVSQSHDFKSETLATHMKLVCKIHTIDRNKFNNNPVFINPRGDGSTISLESVGTACWNSSDINLNFNFSNSTSKNELQSMLEKVGVKKPIHFYLLSSLIVSIFLIGILSIALMGINNFLISSIAANANELDRLKKLQITPASEFDLRWVVLTNYNQNLEFLNIYDAIGAVIPEKLWVESIFIHDDLNFYIKGKSYTIEDIITYFQNIQKITKIKNLKIKKLEIETVDLTGSSSGSSVQELPGALPRPSRPTGAPPGMFNDEIMGYDPITNLPPPPAPDQEQRGYKQNYYQFVFSNYEPSTQIEPAAQGLPDFVKRMFDN